MKQAWQTLPGLFYWIADGAASNGNKLMARLFVAVAFTKVVHEQKLAVPSALMLAGQLSLEFS